MLDIPGLTAFTTTSGFLQLLQEFNKRTMEWLKTLISGFEYKKSEYKKSQESYYKKFHLIIWKCLRLGHVYWV